MYYIIYSTNNILEMLDTVPSYRLRLLGSNIGLLYETRDVKLK